MGFGYNLGFFIGFMLAFFAVYFLSTFIISRIILKISKNYIIANLASLAICTLIYVLINPGNLTSFSFLIIVSGLNFLIAQAFWFIRDFLNHVEKFKRHGGAKPFFQKVFLGAYVTGKQTRLICLALGLVLFVLTLCFTNSVLAILLSLYLPFFLAYFYQKFTQK